MYTLYKSITQYISNMDIVVYIIKPTIYGKNFIYILNLLLIYSIRYKFKSREYNIFSAWVFGSVNFSLYNFTSSLSAFMEMRIINEIVFFFYKHVENSSLLKKKWGKINPLSAVIVLKMITSRREHLFIRTYIY